MFIRAVQTDVFEQRCSFPPAVFEHVFERVRLNEQVLEHIVHSPNEQVFGHIVHTRLHEQGVFIHCSFTV